LVVGLVACVPLVGRAAEGTEEALKPLVTLSVSGYDQILKQIAYVGQLGGNAELGKQAEAALKSALQTEELAGLDKTRPCGLVVQTDGQQQFPVFGFLPVTDLKALLKSLEPAIGKAEEEKGVYSIDYRNNRLYVQEKKGWAFISNSTDVLAHTPADPLPLLGGLDKSYDLAVRIAFKNIPAIYRMMMKAGMQGGLQQGMDRRPGESDDEYNVRSKVARQTMEQINQTLDDLDTFVLGVGVDRANATGWLDYSITALPGTKTAEQMATASKGSVKSVVAGLRQKDAAVMAYHIGELAPADVAQIQAAIDSGRQNAMQEVEKQGLRDDQIQQAKKLLGQMLDLVKETVAGRKMDVGLSAWMNAKLLTVVAGSRAVDTTKLDKLLREVVAQAIKDDPDVAGMIKLDAEDYLGFHLHTASVPLNDLGDPPHLRELVGDSLAIVAAIGENSVYLATGRDAVAKLKQVIQESKAQADKATGLGGAAVDVAPIVELAASVADEGAKPLVNKVLGVLQQSPGKAHATLAPAPIPGGVKVRIEFQEGLLRLIGAAKSLVE
jgi:hypothetical protein